MSLIPIRSFSDQLPVIFVEARMQGNPNAVLAQLGLSLDADECNVALFSVLRRKDNGRMKWP
ncbi:unnamed protein product [Toxocara canis]|uniref:Transposase n=1 Tax=Toxocara canis TaxID=6265 RepID=A0A183V6A8_TOXCA|nr:unnamed protein product [Toxocara canis]